MLLLSFAGGVAAALVSQSHSGHELRPADESSSPSGIAIAMGGVLRALLTEPIQSTFRRRVIQSLEGAGLQTDTFIVVVSNVTCTSAQSSVASCTRDNMDNDVTANHTQELRAAVQQAYAPMSFTLLPEHLWMDGIHPGCAPWNSDSVADTAASVSQAHSPLSYQSLASRSMQQWVTFKRAYDEIGAAEARRGRRYAWIMKTRTDIAFFEDLGPIIAAKGLDRVYVPRNGMAAMLGSRCHNDHIFFCPRGLCRPYFEMLELFESGRCRGASGALDADPTTLPSVFAERRNGVLVPNGLHGPPTHDYWLPLVAQRGFNGSEAEFDIDGPGSVHYDPEYWFASRYSQGERCSGFEDTTCCGVLDDTTMLHYAVARFSSSSGQPDEITCQYQMVDFNPEHYGGYNADAVINRNTSGFRECVRTSEAWLAVNDTDIFGRGVR